MTGPLADIEAIVRERYDAGAYGDCHLQVHPMVRDLMRSFAPAPGPAQPWAPTNGLAALTGIPIVVDGDLPAGGWRLVRVSRDGPPDFTRHDTVVREGAVP